MYTVIILGAGSVRALAPKSAGRKLPPLDIDYFNIAKSINKAEYKDLITEIYTLFGDYGEQILKSLELTTSYLYLKAVDSTSSQDPYNVAFIDHLTLLYEVLITTTDPLKTGPSTLLYRLIRRELDNVDSPNKLCIITFNYDLLTERVLNEIESHINGVFNFPGCYHLPKEHLHGVTAVRGKKSFVNLIRKHQGISVLKLHGSINWQSAHNSPTPTPNKLFNPKRNITVLNAMSLHPHLIWKKNPQSKKLHMQPIIVPPIIGKKGMMHNAFDPLWKDAADKLKKAKRIIVFGYSCPPLDVEARILFSENIRIGIAQELNVIDINPEIAAQFMQLCSIDKAKLYTSIQAYLGKNSI